MSSIIELYKILGVSLRRYHLIYHSIKGQRGISMEQHKAIVDALRRGSYSETKRLLRKHIRYVEDIVKKQIKEILSDERGTLGRGNSLPKGSARGAVAAKRETEPAKIHMRRGS
jgi:hypothetical protein